MIVFLTIYPVINETEQVLVHPYLTIVLETIIFSYGLYFSINYLLKKTIIKSIIYWLKS